MENRRREEAKEEGEETRKEGRKAVGEMELALSLRNKPAYISSDSTLCQLVLQSPSLHSQTFWGKRLYLSLLLHLLFISQLTAIWLLYPPLH